MKWINLTLSVFYWLVFAYDLEYHRDFFTWIHLGCALLFFYNFNKAKSKED